MKYEFDGSVLRDLGRASSLEWLETNGRGGWAASTVTGLHTRRQHGLLAVTAGDRERPMVLLSRLDETLAVGDDRHDLGVNRFPGAVHPNGHLHLRSFEKEWFPVFTYEAGGAVLRKTVAAIHGEHTTAVVYEVLEAPGAVTLALRPLVAQRDAGALVEANGGIVPYGAFESGVFRIRPYPGTPEWFLSIPGARFEPSPDWWRSFEYTAEGAPGAPAHEDLFTYGTFSVTLEPGDRLGVLVSLDDPRGRDARALVEVERIRREALVRGIPDSQPARRALALAADSLVAWKDTGPAILGGFPDTTERPRDAVVAVPGILLAAGRSGEALDLLRRLAAEAGGDVETTLWLFVAAHAWAQATGETSRAADAFLPDLRAAVARLDEGGFLGVRVDDSGLLVETGSGARLPETNALWCNALSIQADLEKRGGDADAAKSVAARARAVKAAWSAAFAADPPVRAETVFAQALPYGLLPKDAARALLDALEENLLSPVGLRVDDRSGRPVHVPALLGAYATACVKVMGAPGKSRARKVLEAVAPLLATGVLGHVPDACDAREGHAPLGAAASARGTGELLRAWKLVGVPRPSAARAAKKRAYRIVPSEKRAAVRTKPRSDR
jgi:glycogen debranching enzyme